MKAETTGPMRPTQDRCQLPEAILERMPVERRVHGAYPAMFACPNAVSRDPASGRMSGAAYVMSPWAKVSAAS